MKKNYEKVEKKEKSELDLKKFRIGEYFGAAGSAKYCK